MTRNLLEDARRDRERLDQASLSPQESVRLREGIDAALVKPRPWGRILAIPALASAAAAILVVMLVTKEPAEPSWYRVVRGDPCVERLVDRAVTGADCAKPVELAFTEGSVKLGPGTKLIRKEKALQLKVGTASFTIRPQVAGKKFEVEVSAGTIITIATMFEVEQRADGGKVLLVSGRIEFKWNDGDTTNLEAGETLEWPKIEVEETLPEPLEKPVRKQKRKLKAIKDEPIEELVPDIHAIMRRLSQLRSQRRYAEAVRMLREASEDERLSRAQRERLSFEAGVLLIDQLQDQTAACTHWRKHAARFPTGTRTDQVRQLMQACPH